MRRPIQVRVDNAVRAEGVFVVVEHVVAVDPVDQDRVARDMTEAVAGVVVVVVAVVVGQEGATEDPAARDVRTPLRCRDFSLRLRILPVRFNL
jgi:hypothetical protein